MTGRQVLGVLLGLVVTVAGADALLARTSPVLRLREVEDALADLRHMDPDVLVISSSHGRSFHALGLELARRTSGRVALLAVPLEAGKVRAMDWVLENRIMPALEETDGRGQRRRQRLQELIFGVTWWDTCERSPEQPAVNIISWGWTPARYFGDVWANGATRANGNYPRFRLRRLLWFSRLLSGEPPAEPLNDLKRYLGLRYVPDPENARKAAEELQAWRRSMEVGRECLLSPTELSALERMEHLAASRGLKFTVVLFPLIPKTITPEGQVTLQQFAVLMRERAARLGYRAVDMTHIPGLTNDDFRADMDHLNEAGNALFTQRALAVELADLLTISPRSATSVSSARAP